MTGTERRAAIRKLAEPAVDKKLGGHFRDQRFVDRALRDSTLAVPIPGHIHGRNSASYELIREFRIDNARYHSVADPMRGERDSLVSSPGRNVDLPVVVSMDIVGNALDDSRSPGGRSVDQESDLGDLAHRMIHVGQFVTATNSIAARIPISRLKVTNLSQIGPAGCKDEPTFCALENPFSSRIETFTCRPFEVAKLLPKYCIA